jgi:hypothetical protein
MCGRKKPSFRREPSSMKPVMRWGCRISMIMIPEKGRREASADLI